MHPCVTFSAQRDQVRFLVASRLAAEFEVMDLQILHAPAELTSPAVALQHLAVQFLIVLRIESLSRGFGWDLLHEACPATSDRKASCCSPGRNLKSREMDCSRSSGLLPSIDAAARKSAQIIARE